MKRLIRLLARLYPSSWRKRYSTEFDALLEEAPPSVRHAFDVFYGALKAQITTWSFRRIVFACSLAGILAAAALSFALPVHYLSKSVLTVTPSDDFAPGNESAILLVNSVVRNVVSRESLSSIILQRGLYPRERAHMSADDVIEKMRRNIWLIPVPPDPRQNRDALTFVVQFDYPDRYVAQQVNQDLMSRLIEANLNPQLNSHSTFYVLNAPTLLVASAPNRTQFAAVGLFAGLLFGLRLAVVVRSRRGTLAS